MIVAMEKNPKANVEIAANATPKKFLLFNSRNTARVHRIVTNKSMMAKTIFPNLLFLFTPKLLQKACLFTTILLCIFCLLLIHFKRLCGVCRDIIHRNSQVLREDYNEGKTVIIRAFRHKLLYN